MKKPKAKVDKFLQSGTGHIYARMVLRNWLGLRYDSWWVLIGYEHNGI
jgi:hypothetical protein